MYCFSISFIFIYLIKLIVVLECCIDNQMWSSEMYALYYCCISHSLYSTSTCCSISHLIFLVFFQSNMETLKAATVADGEAPRSSAQAVSSELDL